MSGDVADGIVEVAEILDSTSRRIWWLRPVIRKAGSAVGEQMGQAERQRVVFVGRADAVPVVNARALAFRVVVDVGDDVLGCRVDVEQRRWLVGLFQPDIHPLQQVRLVVARANHVELGAGPVAVRGDELDRAVEGVEACAAGERLVLQQGASAP